jgi:hypothetical protein
MDMADQLRSRKRGKPGELLMLGGGLCLLAVPLVWSLNGDNDRQLAAIEETGVVGLGTITDKAIVEETHTNRRGVSQTATIHRIAVNYDLNATMPFRQWKASGETLESSDAIRATGWIDVMRFEYDGYAIGQQEPVVFLSGQNDSLMLAEQLRFRASPLAHGLWLAAYGIGMLSGIIMVVLGWKKRFRAHTA